MCCSSGEAPKDPREDTVLSIGAWLATIAIETAGLNADLRYRSEFDQLTGIYNRFSFEKRMDALIDQSREMSERFSVIYIDINLFKKINDTYGHRVGDLYLQAAAKRMNKQLRGARDTLARVGGDEFCALVPLESVTTGT